MLKNRQKILISIGSYISMDTLVNLLGLEELYFVSSHMNESSIQDSFRYRTKQIGLRLASRLLDSDGNLKLVELKSFYFLLKKTPYFIGMGASEDGLIYRHILNCLELLIQNPQIWQVIQKFSLPLCHKRAEKIIRETLFPEKISVLADVHLRKAVMASWFTLLRQTTGSCFATAPAILIQQTQPLLFLKDLYDLLSLGQLKRIYASTQYSVPLSLNFSSGESSRIGKNLEKSPSIWTALKMAGVEKSPFLEKRIQEIGSSSPESLIKSLLMEHFDLTDEDLKNEEYLAKIQMTPLFIKQSAVFYQRPSERSQKVASWKKGVSIALSSFQTFTECALLRSWEYTLASFCDVKLEFARWNLYIGLGMHPEHPGGVGAFLFGYFDRFLKGFQKQIDQLSSQYEEAILRIRSIELIFRQSSDPLRKNKLRGDLSALELSLQQIVNSRNELIEKADSISEFFPTFLKQYDLLFQRYFQELFDPTITGKDSDILDDSTAGFRLIYKHGREDASLWSEIHNQEEYIDSLCEFFSTVENEIDVPKVLGKGFIEQITTDLIRFIRDPEFIKGAISRSKEKGRNSPWDYPSGGTLQGLLLAYMNRENPFTEKRVIPKSPEDLLKFFIDLKGDFPNLIHSPTHAFIFYPKMINIESKKEVKTWNYLEQKFLLEKICEKLPSDIRDLFLHLFLQKKTMKSNPLFRNALVEVMGKKNPQIEMLVDSVLYENTPLISRSQAIDTLLNLENLLQVKIDYTKMEGDYFGPIDLYKVVKGQIPIGFYEIDWDQKIVTAMKKLGVFPPLCTLFADTNWSFWQFGFVYSPASGSLELWRLTPNGMQGFPMNDWKMWLESNNIGVWVALSNPKEYEYKKIN